VAPEVAGAQLTGAEWPTGLPHSFYRIDKEEEMKKPAQKLKLNRETLHDLTLTAVSGGIFTTPYTHCLCSIKVCTKLPGMR
jgi:hypothetical protein